MPRKESQLVEFLQEGLDANMKNIKIGKDPKYKNLIYEDLPKKDVFSLELPHKTSRLDMKYELIFKNWYTRTGRKYNFRKDYSDAKQAMTSSLRKSDYVELDIYDNKLKCRILSGEEVKEKKRLKKELKKLKAEQKNNESEASNESDYDSGINSPESFRDFEQNDSELAQIVQLDHPYALSPPERASAERNGFPYEVQNDSTEAMVIDEITETFGRFLPSDHDKNEIKSNIVDACLMKDSFNIPVCSKDNTLEDLYNIPYKDFIGFNSLQLAPQVPDLTDAEAKKQVKSYVCKNYMVMDKVVVLMCELFEEMDDGIAVTSGSIRIIYEDSVQAIIQDYTRVKDLLPIDDHYLMVFLERPFISHR